MTETLAASPLVRAIALALIEFVWQGAAIGLATALVLFFLRAASAPLRYIVACAGLAAMTVAPLVTAAGYLREERNPAHVRATVGFGSPETLAIPDEPTLSVAAGLERRLLFRAWLESKLPLVMAVWCSGVLLLSAHLLGGWLGVRRIRGSATLLERSRWPERVAAVAGRFRLTRRVRLLVSSVVDVPAVIGCVRPAILVPASALSGLSPLYLEAILLHELAHVRRGDYLVNVGQCVVEVLLFYHPAVWWVSNQIRREREHCCDDIAASLCADQVTYARALTSLEELRIAMPRLAVGAAGGDLLARIRRLVEPDRVSSPRLSGGLAMSVVFTLAVLALNAHLASSSGSTNQAAAPVIQSPAMVPSVAPDSVSPSRAPLRQTPSTIVPTRPSPALPPERPTEIAPEQVTLPRDPAQTGVGALSGVVRDQTGGVIPGARVTLSPVNASTAPRTTNSRGEFAIGDLPVGAYELSVSLPGFRTSRNAIQVSPGQTLTVAVRLDIGSLTETVTVNSPSASARASAPVRQAPANPQTASDYFDAARALYEQARMAEAAAMTARAVELLRAATSEVPIEVTPDSVQATAASVTAPVRVGGSIKEPRKLRHVPPIFPADAAAAGLEGVVILEAVIATDGAIKDVTVLRSVPVFEEAAIGAVRQWLFSPTLLNGVPVEVSMTVTVHFAR